MESSAIREVTVYSPDIRGRKGLTPNHWTYPGELWTFLLGSKYTAGHHLRGKNANTHSGCRHGCVYCYAHSLIRRWGGPYPPCVGQGHPAGVVQCNPLQLDAIVEDISRANRWREPAAVVLSTMTDPFLSGDVVNATRAVIHACAKAGVPVVTLSKGIPPPDIWPAEATDGFCVAAGWTVTCARDEDSLEIEPGAPPSSERWDALGEASAILRERPYPARTWASLTPLNRRSGDVDVMAEAAYDAGASCIVAEIMHKRSSACRDLLVPGHQVPALIATLLAVGVRLGLPVFLKDELRDELGSQSDLYVATVSALLAGRPEAEEVLAMLAKLLPPAPTSAPLPSPSGQMTLDSFLGGREK